MTQEITIRAETQEGEAVEFTTQFDASWFQVVKGAREHWGWTNFEFETEGREYGMEDFCGCPTDMSHNCPTR